MGLVRIYPSAFSQVVEGLEQVFQLPHGCFEQTSSTTYPNVLALDYLQRHGEEHPGGGKRRQGLQPPGAISDLFDVRDHREEVSSGSARRRPARR